MSKSAAKIEKEEESRQEVLIYLEDRVMDLLVGRDEPAKTGEIVRGLEIEGLNMRVIRHVLAKSKKFEPVDRRWTLGTRYDSRRPVLNVVEIIIGAYGRPLSVSALAGELTEVFERSRDYYEEVLSRMLAASGKFFEAGEGTWGLSNWLVQPYDTEEDVIFENFLSEDQIAEYEKIASKVKWDPAKVAKGVSDFAAAAGAPVPLKIVEFYAWKGLDFAYDPIGVYCAIADADDLVILSNLTVASADVRSRFVEEIKAIAAELEQAAPEGEEEGLEGGPVEVTEADVAEAVKMILAGPETVTADDVLESVLEVSPGESAYDTAFDNLVAALNQNEQVVAVGVGRWRPAGVIPDYVYEIPEELIIPPHTPYETPEGDIYDQELEDDGLDGTLKNEIMDPLIQDVGDEDPEQSQVQPMGDSQRCVVKYHHKAAGTFPLCQINPEFFGTEPEVIQITLIGDGVHRDAWVSNKTRIIYDMGPWYSDIEDMPLSGAVFHLEKTSKPGQYRFVYDPESDPLVSVPMSRIMELLELKNQAEATETPVFDIVMRILQQHRKGIAFIPLFTEVSLVHRVGRRLVASILSSYHAFYQAKKTNEWQYDEKKRTQGFNKTKRKYIKK